MAEFHINNRNMSLCTVPYWSASLAIIKLSMSLCVVCLHLPYNFRNISVGVTKVSVSFYLLCLRTAQHWKCPKNVIVASLCSVSLYVQHNHLSLYKLPNRVCLGLVCLCVQYITGNISIKVTKVSVSQVGVSFCTLKRWEYLFESYQYECVSVCCFYMYITALKNI